MLTRNRAGKGARQLRRQELSHPERDLYAQGRQDGDFGRHFQGRIAGSYKSESSRLRHKSERSRLQYKSAQIAVISLMRYESGQTVVHNGVESGDQRLIEAHNA
eukprot:2942313-Rhodomonas_salina.1